MRRLSIALLLLLMVISPTTFAEVYKCTDRDGRVTYTNDRSLARQCERIKTDLPVTSVPSPARRPLSPSSAGSNDFPRIAPDTQRARDATRSQILQTELESEEKSLVEAQAALAEQEAIRHGDERNYQRVLDRLQPFKDRVELHQRNIQALQREIRTLR